MEQMEISREKLIQHLDGFLQEASTRPRTVNTLTKYLTATPIYESMEDLLPNDEMEERLELAMSIEQEYGDMQASTLAVIMTLPMREIRDSLRNIRSLPDPHAIFVFAQRDMILILSG